jgi:hypothetical protein
MRATVSREHRRLDELLRELETSLADLRDPESGRDAFAALAEQVDVHFEQEESLYYAPIAALRRELEPRIRAIFEAHVAFRQELALVGSQLERGDAAGARLRIAAFAEAFQRHEAREESLLEQVEVELRRSAATDGG